MRRSGWLATVVGGCAAVLAMAAVMARTPSPPGPDLKWAVDVGGLHQVVAFHRRVFSGARPEGALAVTTLAKWGVGTVITVDGLPIDVDRVRAAGMDVIHLPWGYGRPDEQDVAQISAALQAGLSQGTVYVHCHHGRHRSASAAAVGLVSLGMADVDTMMQRMAVAGTDLAYDGLWSVVRDAVPLDPTTRVSLDAFQACVPPRGVTALMLQAEAALDDLHDMVGDTRADGQADETAGELVECLRALGTHHALEQWGSGASVIVADTTRHAEALERSLVNQRWAQAAELVETLSTSCTACHRAFR